VSSLPLKAKRSALASEGLERSIFVVEGQQVGLSDQFIHSNRGIAHLQACSR
jgi:hypothetical protein